MREKIAFVLVGIIVIIAIAIYYSNVEKKSHIRQLSPEQVAQQYYNNFSECMQHPPTEAQGNVDTYCQSHNPFAGKHLSTNLTKQYAPVICAQNPPQAVAPTGNIHMIGNLAKVTMQEHFGAKSEPVMVMYQLQQEHKEWKVSDIQCLNP
jgi:hypothetical protein